MNLRENILPRMPEICGDEGVDPRIFDSRAGPEEDSDTKEIKEKIRKGYVEFLGGIAFDMAEKFYGNGTGYPRRVKERMEKIIERCFEGGLRGYLQDIKQKYPEEIWKLEN